MVTKDHLESEHDIIYNNKRTSKKLGASQYAKFTHASSTETSIIGRKAATKDTQGDYTGIGSPYNNAYGTVGLMTVQIDFSRFNSLYNVLLVNDDIDIVFENLPLGNSIEFAIDITNTVASPVINFLDTIVNLPTLPSALNDRYVIKFLGVHDSTGTKYIVVGTDISGAGTGANTALSNLAAVAINTSLISDTDITDDLGSAVKSWRNLFVQQIQFAISASTPAANGVFYFDGTDVKVKTGSVVKNLSNIGGVAGANTTLSNLTNPTSINQSLLFASALLNIGDTTNPVNNLFAKQLRLQSGTITSNKPMITADASDNLLLNAPDLGHMYLSFNGVTKFDFTKSSLRTDFYISDQWFLLNDSALDPNINGMFRLNGADVKVFSGGAVRNLSSSGGANTALSNLTNPTSINQSLLFASALLNIGDTTNPVNSLFVKQVRLQAGTVTSNRPMITADGSDNMIINAPDLAHIYMSFNGVVKFDFTKSSLRTNFYIADQYVFLSDSATDPNVNGMFRVNGTDVKVFSGGVLRNFSNVGGLADLTDVITGGLAAGQYLRYGGALWNNSFIPSADIPNLDASKITTGTLVAARGGTGNNTYVVGDLLYASGAATLSRRAIGATNTHLIVTGGVPVWSFITNAPYLSTATDSPSNATLDAAFGATDGCIGVQFYTSTSSTRFYARANGSWKRVVLS